MTLYSEADSSQPVQTVYAGWEDGFACLILTILIDPSAVEEQGWQLAQLLGSVEDSSVHCALRPGQTTSKV